MPLDSLWVAFECAEQTRPQERAAGTRQRTSPCKMGTPVPDLGTNTWPQSQSPSCLDRRIRDVP
eukprot:33026-Rhodomonas_salina.2